MPVKTRSKAPSGSTSAASYTSASTKSTSAPVSAASARPCSRAGGLKSSPVIRAPSRDSEIVSVPMWHWRWTPRSPDDVTEQGQVEPDHVGDVRRVAAERREVVVGRRGVRGRPLVPAGPVEVAVSPRSSHGCPFPARVCFTSPIRSVPKWKTVAASTASAPAATAGAKWSRRPAPPEAMTGMVTSRRTAVISSRSKPSWVPSASMALRRISPAPSCAARAAHSIASRPADSRPPWVVTSKPQSVPGARRASTLSTRTWLPNRSAISATSSGRWMAAVLTATLSAPARSSRSTSSTEDTPPPTVSGMKTSSAHRETTSIVVARPSCDAEMSRKVSSSAPSAS